MNSYRLDKRSQEIQEKQRSKDGDAEFAILYMVDGCLPGSPFQSMPVVPAHHEWPPGLSESGFNRHI